MTKILTGLLAAVFLTTSEHVVVCAWRNSRRPGTLKATAHMGRYGYLGRTFAITSHVGAEEHERCPAPTGAGAGTNATLIDRPLRPDAFPARLGQSDTIKTRLQEGHYDWESSAWAPRLRLNLGSSCRRPRCDGGRNGSRTDPHRLRHGAHRPACRQRQIGPACAEDLGGGRQRQRR